MKLKLSEIRQPCKITAFRTISVALAIAIFGALTGIFGKALDVSLVYFIEYGTVVTGIYDGIAAIMNSFSFWAFTVTLISIYSPSPLAAAYRSFLYLLSMNIAYYVYSSAYYGLTYYRWFIMWTILAVFASVAGAVLWYAMGEGRVSLSLSALPASFILAEGYVYFMRIFENRVSVYDIPELIVSVFTVLSAVTLILAARKTAKERLIAVGGAVAISPVFYLGFRLLMTH